MYKNATEKILINYTTWKVIYGNPILVSVYTFVGAHGCAPLIASILGLCI